MWIPWWKEKMNIFEILNNLYTQTSSKWILDVDDRDISPVVIQRFLVLNGAASEKAAILNKLVFSLSPKMYLSAAWTLLFFNRKKLHKAPYVKYPSSKKTDSKYRKILDKVKSQYKMSDKDFKVVEPFVIKALEEDIYNWYSYYGMTEREWLAQNLDIDHMKNYGDREVIKPKVGLDAWFG